jgi:hypothetical protein
MTLNNRIGNKLWFWIILLPILIPSTNAGVHYAFTIIISLFIIAFNRTHKSIVLLILMLLLYLLAFISMGSDASSLRYIVIGILLSQIRFVPTESLTKAAFIIIILNTIWSMFELLFPESQLRLLFRSSLQEFHILRTSGLFAFPGDLGHFAVSFFTYFVVLKPQIRFRMPFTSYQLTSILWICSVLCCLLLLATSQSRLAFIQLAISLVLIALRQSLFSILLLGGALTLILSFIVDIDYILSTDWLAIYDALVNINTQSQFKRVSDLGLLFSGQAGMLPVALPEDVAFVESGFVSQFFRMGGIASILILILILITGIIGFFKSARGSLLLAVSVISLSLLATNFVGAPFERPKLMFYSAIFLSILFHLTYKVRKTVEK